MLMKNMPKVNSIISFSNRAIKIFQQVLYIDPSFNCSNEVHLRLGIIFKAQGSCEASVKVSNILDTQKPLEVLVIIRVSILTEALVCPLKTTETKEITLLLGRYGIT